MFILHKILICDDEVKIRRTLSDYLSAKGFNVLTAQDGEEAIDFAKNNDFDLIILDVMMPNVDGLSACREIRKFSNTPILFLSALGEEYNLLNGYNNGADDYVVKPFALSVLFEKCIAMVKRYRGVTADNKLVCKDITLDLNNYTVLCGDKTLQLTGKNFEILKYLMQNKDIVLSREQILQNVWGYDFFGDSRSVDSHIKQIRKTLGERSKLIKTISGIGYSFTEEK